MSVPPPVPRPRLEPLPEPEAKPSPPHAKPKSHVALSIAIAVLAALVLAVGFLVLDQQFHFIGLFTQPQPAMTQQTTAVYVTTTITADTTTAAPTTSPFDALWGDWVGTYTFGASTWGMSITVFEAQGQPQAHVHYYSDVARTNLIAHYIAHVYHRGNGRFDFHYTQTMFRPTTWSDNTWFYATLTDPQALSGSFSNTDQGHAQLQRMGN